MSKHEVRTSAKRLRISKRISTMFRTIPQKMSRWTAFSHLVQNTSSEISGSIISFYNGMVVHIFVVIFLICSVIDYKIGHDLCTCTLHMCISICIHIENDKACSLSLYYVVMFSSCCRYPECSEHSILQQRLIYWILSCCQHCLN